jgi:hypothetical protein
MYYLLLVLEILLIVYYKQLNAKMDDWKINKALFFSVVSIPLLLITYLDIMYNTFSLKSLGLSKKYDRQINYVLSLFGSYGMIQILAQDSGLKTGEIQRDTVQKSLLFSLIALGTAFSITANRSQAMIGVLYYFHLKYIISNNKTSPVCFEDV